MSLVRDGVAVSGAALMLFGLAQWSLPAMYVVGGLLLVGAAFCWSAVRREA
jgi:type IV secretory pathway VirB2 component (pilin)